MLKKNILIVYDNSFDNVLKLYLEKSGYKVYTAFYGKQIFNILENVMPSLIILDIMQPDITGEKICALLIVKYDVPVIILSAKASEDDVLNGYNNGAYDYIIKPFSPRQLVAKVTALLKRISVELTPLDKHYSFNNGEIVIDILKHQIKKDGKEIKTTPIEYKLLVTMVKYPKVFTRKELLALIFDSNYKGKERVIDTHIKNLRQKIETNPKKPQYILTVNWTGYRFDCK